ncbi:hypothetical protein CARUB_v10006487mg [Capsella rubella]|uniref:Uncharacterized protein n=1 Tax=Capsella rubella TaxID=81985 RepID=R0F840_9BRAS|nr:uncharacterized protein LOC17880202 [Capsella rubella]EOA18042.1 hypothetical protein CARUB_v10006487mg [Capsella rubella]
MARRHFSFAILVIICLALAGGAYAAGSSSPSPPATTSNTTETSSPETIFGFNATKGNSQDYSDYEVPTNLAPDGVEVVEDYVPISVNSDKDNDVLAQPEGESDKKTTQQPKDSSSSSSSSYSYSSFVVLFVVVFVLRFDIN